jgi:hypothetical protein
MSALREQTDVTLADMALANTAQRGPFDARLEAYGNRRATSYGRGPDSPSTTPRIGADPYSLRSHASRNGAGHQRARPVVEREPYPEREPYIALFLGRAADDPLQKDALWLPLVVASLISDEFRLVLPIESSATQAIDSAFDGALKALELGGYRTIKEFVANSKGVQYAKDLSAEEKEIVLEDASFALTTDEGARKAALGKGLPHVFISRRPGGEPDLKCLCLVGGRHEWLKRCLLECVDVGLQVERFAKYPTACPS